MYPNREKMRLGLTDFKAALSDASGKYRVLALDCETDGLDKRTARVTWISWAINEEFGAISLAHRNLCGNRNTPIVDVKALIGSLLRDPSLTITFHNAAFDLSVLACNGFLDLDSIEAKISDTLVASRALNPVKRKEGRSHKLKVLYNEMLREPGDPPQPSFEAVCDGLDFCDIPYREAAWYASFDTWTTLRVHQLLSTKLALQPDLHRYYQNVEVPHIFTQLEIEGAGISLADPSTLGSLNEHFIDAGLASTKAAIFKLFGKSFNIDSPRALQSALFFGKPHIKPLGRSKTGKGHNISTTILEEILAREKNPANVRLISFVLVYKMLNERKKIISGFYRNRSEDTGRAYTSLDSAVSGRFTTKGVNTLALSSASGIKDAIRAPEGKIFVIADYGQIDFRVLANETGAVPANSTMLRYIDDGYDLHLVTLGFYFPEVRALKAKRLWKKDGKLAGIIDHKGAEVPFSDTHLEALQRVAILRGQLAKRINFGISYGMGVSMLALNLNYNEDLHAAVASFPFEISAQLHDPSDAALKDLNDWMGRVRAASRLGSKEDGTKYAQAEVDEMLTRFGIEYSELEPVKKNIEEDLQTRGATSNIFGRLCSVPVAPHFWNCTVDIEPTIGKFFRAKIHMYRMNKRAVCCSFGQVRELSVKKSSKRAASLLFTDHSRTAGRVLYEFKADCLAPLFHAGTVNMKILDDMRDTHANAAIDADELFDHLTPASLGDLDLADTYPEASQRVPIFFLPHAMVRAVIVPQLGIELHYPGYGKMLRELVSARIQSTSMDFCKIAMASFRTRAKAEWPDVSRRPIIFNCVHDEIAVECWDGDADRVKILLKECMEDHELYRRHLAPGALLKVKIEADVKAGKTYADAKP